MSTRIKTNYAEKEALAPNFSKDAAWISKNRIVLYEKYGSCVLLVYHEEVIGRGATVKEAIADAENHLPDNDASMITPVVKHLSSPYRIRVLRHKKEEQ
jgi:hypothetical protein